MSCRAPLHAKSKDETTAKRQRRGPPGKDRVTAPEQITRGKSSLLASLESRLCLGIAWTTPVAGLHQME